MRRKQIVHYKVNLLSSRMLDTVQDVEPAPECTWIRLDVAIVLVEDRKKEFVLCVANSLDDESVIARKVEE